MTVAVARPAETEHAPYYSRYISLVPEGDLIVTLEQQIAELSTFLRGIPEAKGGHRYAEGKWTIKEVVGHLIDSERVFAYRALRFGRQDPTPLPGYDENLYTPAGRFDRRTLADLIAEWELVRRSNLAMFRGFPEDAWPRMGLANADPITVRALAYILAGHTIHHTNILRERYLS